MILNKNLLLALLAVETVLVLCIGFELVRYNLASFNPPSEPELDFTAEVERNLQEGNLAKAEILCQYVDYDPTVQSEGLADACKKAGSWTVKAKQFGSGLLTGQANNSYASAGSLAGDVVGIGDIRDLVRETFLTDEPDNLVRALSAAGLAATVMPHLSSALSVLKICKKTGAASPALVKNIKSATSAVLKYTDKAKLLSKAQLVELAKILQPLTRLYENTGKSFRKTVKLINICDDLTLVANVADAVEDAKTSAKLVAVMEVVPESYTGENRVAILNYLEGLGPRGIDRLYSNLKKSKGEVLKTLNLPTNSGSLLAWLT